MRRRPLAAVGDLVIEIVVRRFGQLAGPIEFSFGLVPFSQRAIDAREAPVNIDLIGSERRRGLQLAQGIVITAGVGVNDAEIEVTEPQAGVELDRFGKQRTRVVGLVQLEVGVA